MSLADKFAKNSKLKGSGLFSKKVEEEVKMYDTNIPALNLAYSGDLFGGTKSGVTCIAGKSKSFKTLFGLIACKAYMDEHPDAFMLFYDSEGGASKEYYEQVGIDTNRVIYLPIMNIEELKFDLVPKLEEIRKEHDEAKKESDKPRFIVFCDSIGNLASMKEINDALSDNSAADMGIRAKSLKALFRIMTPYFKRCEMQMIAIMHTYDEMAAMGAPKQIMSGGTGPLYSSDQVFIVRKRQIKEGKEIVGWEFILDAEKSRDIREKSSIPFEVMYGQGINRFSALLDLAIASGHVIKPKQGWYSRTNVEDDKNWRRKETSCDEFWDPILNDESFVNAVKEMYRLDGGDPLIQKKLDKLIENEDFDAETGEIFDKD